MQLVVIKTWKVNGTPTNPTSVTLTSLVEDDNSAVIASNVAMTQTATGVYQYVNASVNGGTTYTATITVVYNGQTITETVVVPPDVNPAQICWPHGFTTILNQLMSLAAQITLSPNPTYSVEGHSYQKGEYLEILGRQIEQFSKLNAQANPFEIITRGDQWD
jgi:hypothetical protein